MSLQPRSVESAGSPSDHLGKMRQGEAMNTPEDRAGSSLATVHPVYLPFHRDQLRAHFAAVRGGKVGAERHLRYYETSARVAMQHHALHEAAPAGARILECTPLNHQVEKDERFWIVAALMALFHAPNRQVALAELLSSSFPRMPGLAGLGTWEEALVEDKENPLQLFFEVNLPSPLTYRQWLAENGATRTILPWIQAKAVGMRQEGSTKADAMLVAPKTGFAVVFEAKVLSDASTHTERDALRNQIARNLDVLLDANDRVQPPLNLRDPRRSCFVLLTPELFKTNPASRLYGSLIPAYQSGTELLQQHLPHRTASDLQGVNTRVGWTTFEECNRILPGACSWLPKITS